MAHPQMVQHDFDPSNTAEFNMKPLLTPYSPVYTNYQNQVFNNILAGPGSSNILVPSATDQIIFDAETNKPISDYLAGYDKFYISAKLYKDKHLIYRDKDGAYQLVKGYNRFPVIVNENANGEVKVPEVTASSIALRQNPLQQFDMYVGIRNNTHSWKLTYKKSIEMIDGKLVGIHGGTPRQETVWDETPKKITNKLVQVSERGLNSWRWGGWMEDEGYYFKELNSKSILLNYDIEVSDIDFDRGRILFLNDVPEDLKISYCLNDEWEVIPEELNPIVKQKLSSTQSIPYTVPNEIKIKIDKNNGGVYYELNGNGRILQNGTPPNWLEDTLEYERYTDVATVKFNYDNPEKIDIRREGGMLINKQNDLYDIDSHVTWGFMGNNPTELNISIVKIPDVALENLIYQFEEEMPQYDPNNKFTFPLDWDNYRETYLNFIKYDPEELQTNDNPIREELLLYSKRVMPAGIRIAIADKLNNLLFYDADNSVVYGDYL